MKTSQLARLSVSAVLVSAACASAAQTSRGPVAAPTSRRSEPITPFMEIAAVPKSAAADAAWADSVLKTLTLRQKAAQMVWIWTLGDYSATDAAAYTNIERLVREQELGGIIVSVGGPLDIAAKVNALQAVVKLPLLVGADLETGAAFRARGGWFLPNAIELGGATSFPYQMGVGASRDTALAYEMGRVTAIEGRAMGIHMAFAPVLDVNNNPKNPVIAARSFGEDPELVSRMGAALVRGMVSAVRIPVTAKMRLGWDDDNLTAPDLARALEEIAEAGYWRIGLSGHAEVTLDQALTPGRNALVLGAEGDGMRRNIEEHCDQLAKLPISAQMESLNVSNAAAIALYAATVRRGA